MAKVLCSLTLKFDYVVIKIEESNNISKLSFYKLTGYFEAHEVRVNMVAVRIGKRALHVRSETVPMKEGESGNSSIGTS